MADVNGTQWTDRNVTGGFGYSYRVAAVGPAGAGNLSESVVVIVPVPAEALYAGLIENAIVLTLPALFYVSFVHGFGPRRALEALGLKGERVGRGHTLGTVGSTGRATGPHLHLGAYLGGARVDPATLLGLRLE